MGVGVFGSVYKIKYNNEIKAFKEIDCIHNVNGIDVSILIEISILNYVSHANLLDLDKIVYTSDNKCYSIIFEYMEKDLKSVIGELSIYQIKRYSNQLLQAVEYLHINGIIHRDIKPQNILIKGNDIKLADYGISLPMVVTKGSYNQNVVTLWYRPIELLMGIQQYSFEIDIWSCGCVISEMNSGNILFPGDSNIDTIYRIMRSFGSSDFFIGLPEYRKSMPQWKRKDLKEVFFTDDEQLINMLEGMFTYNPDNRDTATTSLSYPWLIY